jgi:diketogulonate reductase-like aldo/keto reductase
VEQSIISSAGVCMPRILYGTAWKKSDTARLVTAALQRGFRGVDTACQPKHYDEAAVGAALKACLGRILTRAELYLQTKFTPVSGQDPRRIPYDSHAPLGRQVAQSFSASLHNLQVDHVDALVLHSPLADVQQTMEVWQAMESLVGRGAVGQLGISNCYRLEDLKALHSAAHVKPAVIQNRFYAESGYDRDIRAFCREQGILYQSFWTLSANPQVLDHESVKVLVTKYQRSPAQILFRYLTQNSVVPLTGTRSETHMGEALEIFQFELTESECSSIHRLL